MKKFIEENKTLYLFITRDMVCNSLQRISKNLQNAPPIILSTNNIPLQTNNSSISSDNDLVIEVNLSSNLVSTKLRGQPAGTTNNDK